MNFGVVGTDVAPPELFELNNICEAVLTTLHINIYIFELIRNKN